MVGSWDGRIDVGWLVDPVGSLVTDGSSVGAGDGFCVGWPVGSWLGGCVGSAVGKGVGSGV